MPQIVILIHQADRFPEARYFAWAMADEWRARGLEVEVRNEPVSCGDAKLAMLHVDLTVTPNEYVRAVNDCSRTINGNVIDISKRKISRNLVGYFDRYDGPVIVKTNRNFGGTPESAHDTGSSRFTRRLNRYRKRLGWAWQTTLPVGGYRIFNSSKEVPRAVWFNRSLVVEKFLSEQRDGKYCLRTWVFLGDRETNALWRSDKPIVKLGSGMRREVVPDVPDDLRQMRRELKFDFGKFDYAIVDGKVVLYDANRTPGLGAATPEEYLPRIKHLAGGIDCFL